MVGREKRYELRQYRIQCSNLLELIFLAIYHSLQIFNLAALWVIVCFQQGPDLLQFLNFDDSRIELKVAETSCGWSASITA